MRKTTTVLCLVSSILLAVPVAALRQPNLILILSDDHGFNNIGIRNSNMSTPHMDQLVRDGVLLSRHYVFKFCSPSRSSAMSGRLPIHVNQENSATEQPHAGVALNFTMFPEKLCGTRGLGYSCAQVGKWHCGQASTAHVPTGRGFDSSLGFFNFGEDHYTHVRGGQARRRLNAASPSGKEEEQAQAQAQVQVQEQEEGAGCPNAVDLWNSTGPATGLGGVYGGTLYADEIERVIAAHDPASSPLFMFIAFQNNHAPLQVPEQYESDDRCGAYPPGTAKRTYCGMTAFTDETIGNMTAQLRAKGMWEDTLVVFTADNGGWLQQAGDNTPLFGGKFADLEGGTRTLAWASGGVLPAAVRGTTNAGFIHVADWSTTFLKLGGATQAEAVADARAAAAGLPPIDGLDMWPLLSGLNSTSPRVEVPLSANPPAHRWPNFRGFYASDAPRADGGLGYYVGGEGLIQGRWKLVTGLQHTGPFGGQNFTDCGEGCLFDIFEDEGEQKDLSSSTNATHVAALARLKARLAEVRETVYAPDRGALDPAACEANTKSGGYWSPWLPSPHGWPTFL